MPRRFTPRSRLSGVRDAKLIVIASEGAETEPTYFRELASLANNSRVKVYPVEREDPTLSSPEHVIELLDDFRANYSDQDDEDEFWVVVDLDKWDLQRVARLCSQKGYKLAVSNPCFELWLLLHLKSLDEYEPKTLDEFRTNQRVNSRRNRLDQELHNLLGEYNKSKPKVATYFYPHVQQAIERAKDLDDLSLRWPNDLGSRVYLIAEKIVGK